MRSVPIFLFFLLLVPAAALAQTREHPWSVGLHGGKEEFNGDMGNASYNWSKAFYGFGGISFARYGNPSFDVMFHFNYGEIGYWADADTLYYFNNKFHGNWYGKHANGSVLFKYKFNNGYILREKSRIEPYMFLGWGISWVSGPRVRDLYINHIQPGSDYTGRDMIFPGGVGVTFKVSPRINIYEQTSFIYTDHDSRDGYLIANHDGYLLHQIGVTYNFGKPFVSAMAGDIPSMMKKMECRCEMFDRDSDGIIDRMDMCPDVAGTLQARGCPDRDWDGIPDTLDKCPDVWGTPKFEGCPDTDGDGIPDHLDSCVTVPGIKQFNGCPDTDGDGIPDYIDDCPTVRGIAVFHGCPDSDGDSIPDSKDKCPREAGPRWNQGCPEIKESVKKIFEQALTGIQFETNKAIILPKSFTILDKVVKVMQDNPQYFLIINGHTDDQGDDAKNLILSDGRANAVRLYLVKKGVSAGRLESHGYGETQPIDVNTTPEGRAKNRRVEFKVKIL